ncbi:hypothetical protein RchiOBHm_Chr4g0417551 [Rosa chinensis]|uniref:Uncharacterized protein n=1 Tax=Rosa chinensis TaxID=74649 RepID=A0A2P6QX53_ROSCH|nr:hypothetical protein RchiOBHm_Chr4g0417551 [Rosa chinensis]
MTSITLLNLCNYSLKTPKSGYPFSFSFFFFLLPSSFFLPNIKVIWTPKFDFLLLLLLLLLLLIPSSSFAICFLFFFVNP